MIASVVARLELLFPSALHVATPPRDADLIESSVLDSLALVELLAAIESEFGIQIPLDEIELDRIRTIDALAELISERYDVGAPDPA